jgi:hypothetical protein
VVRFAHQLSETVQIPNAEPLSAVTHAFIFFQHLAASPVDFVGNIFRVLEQLVNRYITQSTNTRIPFRQESCRFLAFPAALIVFPTGVLVLDHRVTNHHPKLYWEWE